MCTYPDTVEVTEEFISDISHVILTRVENQDTVKWSEIVEDIREFNIDFPEGFNFLNVRGVLQMLITDNYVERVPMSETMDEEYRIPKEVY